MTTRDAVFVVAPEHEDRAAKFCQKHRHFTTTEAMDDLAAEFEKVARNTRAEMLLWLRETCGGEGDYHADQYLATFGHRVTPHDHQWEPMKETWNLDYEQCCGCLKRRLIACKPAGEPT